MIGVLEGALQYSLGYLDQSLADCTVTVPRGVEIFKAKGGGQNYDVPCGYKKVKGTAA